MFQRKIHVDNDNSLNKVATNIINENSIRNELKKFTITNIKFVGTYSGKEYYTSQKFLSKDKVHLIYQNDLEKSELDSIFEYLIEIEGKSYKLYIVSPIEFFHASYIYEIYFIY